MNDWNSNRARKKEDAVGTLYMQTDGMWRTRIRVAMLSPHGVYDRQLQRCVLWAELVCFCLLDSQSYGYTSGGETTAFGIL